MRRRGVALVALMLAGGAVTAPTLAQDLSSVLDKYYEAVGGLEAWKSVESMRATGKMVMQAQGLEAPFTMMAKRPKMLRIEFTFQGMTGVQAYDGETAWMIMPFLGKTEPEPMPTDQAKQLMEDADLDGPLIGYEDEGHEVELLGEDMVEGTSAYKLKLTRKNGDVEYWYLDSEYYVPIKVEGSRKIQGSEIEFETTLSDYKDVGGVMVAHSIESKPKGSPSGQAVVIDSVELNVDLEDDEFVMPETEGAGQQ